MTDAIGLEGVTIEISRMTTADKDEPEIRIMFRRPQSNGVPQIRFEAILSLADFTRVLTGQGGIKCGFEGTHFPAVGNGIPKISR